MRSLICSQILTTPTYVDNWFYPTLCIGFNYSTMLGLKLIVSVKGIIIQDSCDHCFDSCPEKNHSNRNVCTDWLAFSLAGQSLNMRNSVQSSSWDNDAKSLSKRKFVYNSKSNGNYLKIRVFRAKSTQLFRSQHDLEIDGNLKKPWSSHLTIEM